MIHTPDTHKNKHDTTEVSGNSSIRKIIEKKRFLLASNFYTLCILLSLDRARMAEKMYGMQQEKIGQQKPENILRQKHRALDQG